MASVVPMRQATDMHAPRLRAALLAATLVALAGCDGLTCSGQGYYFSTTADFPQDQVIDPGLKLRLTREGSEFAEAHGTQLLHGLLGSGQSTDGWVDVSSLLNDYLEQNPISVVGLSARDLVAAARLPDPRGLRIDFLPDPTRIRVSIDELWLRLEMTVAEVDGGAACRVRGEIDGGGPDARMLTVYDLVLDITLAVTPDGGFDVSTQLLALDIADSSVAVVANPADPDFYCNLPECQSDDCAACQSICTNVDFAEDAANFIISTFDQVAASAVETLADTVLDELERLGGEIHPALLLGSLARDLYDAGFVRFAVRPSLDGFSVTPRPDKGTAGGDLNVSLAVGLLPAEPHPCVAPHVGPLPRFAASDLDTVPRGMPGADLVMGVPAGLVDQLLWSLYHSGALCLEIDAATVAELTGGTIDLSAGLLSLLLPGLERLAPRDAPLMLALRPSLTADDLPVIHFGSGAVADDGTVDSLLEINLRAARISIYAGIDDQLVRLFEVEADVGARVTPLVNADGSLGVGIDALDISNLSETYDELFTDVQLETLLSFVVELLGRVLVGNELALPLPLDALVEELLGIPLRIGLSNFAPAGPGGDWLSLSIGLDYDGSGGSGADVVETSLASGQHALELVAGERLVLGPLVGDDLEAQFRIDGLAWSGFRPASQLVIASHLLALPGEHTVEVRARRVGRHRTTDPTPLRLAVTVVPEAVQGDDTPTTPHGGASGGCSVTRSSNAGGHGLLVAAALLLLVVARRRRGLAAAAAAACVALGSLGCTEEGAGREVRCESDRDCAQGQFCGCDGFCAFPQRCATSADCCGGRACTDGFCASRFECRADSDCALGFGCRDCQCQRESCMSDTDCPATLSCRGGVCAPEDSIPCDAACADGELCLVERDVCIAATNVCPGFVCPAGELAVMVSAEGYLGEGCGFEAPGCECVASPPLAVARPGGYVSVVEAGGRLVIGAWEPHYGDLVVMRATGELALGDAEFVDGVPDVRPSAALDGPRGGIAQGGPDVGRYVSGVVAPDGVLAFAAYDAAGRLRMAVQRPGQSQWTRFTLDESGDAGHYVSLAALADSRLVAAYQVMDLAQGTSMLRVAVSRRASPMSASDFTITNVEIAALADGALPCGGGCATDEVCLADTRVCAAVEPPASCAQSCALGSVCVGGQCRTTVASARAGGRAVGTGVDPEVVPLADGRIAVPFYRADAGELAVAVGAPEGPFEVRLGDAGMNRAGFGETDVGRQVSAAMDLGGTMHLAYLDGIAGAVVYATYAVDSGRLGARQVVTDGIGANPPSMPGGLDLALGADGAPRIAWQDTSSGRLMLARRGVDGETWSSVVLDEVGVSGFSPSFAPGGQVVAFGRIRENGTRPYREVGLVAAP